MTSRYDPDAFTNPAEVIEVVPGVLRFIIANPPINLFDPDLYAELRLLVDRMENDEQVRVVIIESADPDYFVAHADRDRLAEVPERPGAASLLETWPEFVVRLATVPVLTIASIRGRCRGIGAEFALACDLRFASRERAFFALPEIGFGVVPGGGGLDWLPGVVGRSRALELALSGDDVSADVAERYGLVNRALDNHELDDHVEALARRVASFDKQALVAIKEMVNRRSALPTAEHLRESLHAVADVVGKTNAAARFGLMFADGWGRDTDTERDHPALTGSLGHRIGDGH